MLKNISIISSEKRYDEALKLFYNAIDFLVLMGYEVEYVRKLKTHFCCAVLNKELEPLKIECFTYRENLIRGRKFQACFVDKTLDIEIINNITLRTIERHEGVYF